MTRLPRHRRLPPLLPGLRAPPRAEGPRRGAPRHRVSPPGALALVTDIGCVGLADAVLPVPPHRAHPPRAGRGDRRRDPALARTGGGEPLKPVVMVGDGGATIGLLHLVHAAQMDVDVTVLVHNNLVYGMTGGQHSGLTPEGFRTTTTPEGCPSRRSTCWRCSRGRAASLLRPGPRPRRPTSPPRSPRRSATRASRAWRSSSSAPPSRRRVGGMTGKGIDQMVADRGPRDGDPRPAASARGSPPPPRRTSDPLAEALVPSTRRGGPWTGRSTSWSPGGPASGSSPRRSSRRPPGRPRASTSRSRPTTRSPRGRASRWRRSPFRRSRSPTPGWSTPTW